MITVILNAKLLTSLGHVCSIVTIVAKLKVIRPKAKAGWAFGAELRQHHLGLLDLDAHVDPAGLGAAGAGWRPIHVAVGFLHDFLRYRSVFKRPKGQKKEYSSALLLLLTRPK